VNMILWTFLDFFPHFCDILVVFESMQFVGWVAAGRVRKAQPVLVWIALSLNFAH
jgi:hypothetical protein